MVRLKVTREGLEKLKDEVDAVKKLGLGEFPQGAPPGTVPIGDGWYKTPNTPADPQDCDRYPDSPWCGGNPIDLSSPFSYSPDAQVHGCGFDLELGGTVAWIKMPPQRLSYRFEGECRREPPPPPEPKDSQPRNRILNLPNAFGNDYFYLFWHQCGEFDPPSQWQSFICPGQTEIVNNTSYYSEINGIGWDSFRRYSSEPYTQRSITAGYRKTASPPYGTYAEYYFDTNGEMVGYWRQGSTYYAFTDQFGRKTYYKGDITASIADSVGAMWAGGEAGLHITKGRWGAICNWLINWTGYDIQYDFLVQLDCGKFNPYKRNPPPDEPCNCNMACCPDYSPLLQQLLNEIKKANAAIGSTSFPVTATIFDEDENKPQAQSKTIKLKTIAESISKIIERNEKLSKIIGIDQLPLELPQSVIVQPESNPLQKALNFLNPFKNEKITSLIELHAWKIKQDSAVLGQWAQVIKIQSTEKKKVMVDGKEIEKEVEKTEEVILPNIAQTMKEQMLLQSQQMKTMGLILDCTVKLMIDVAQAKAISAETVKRVEDVQQYLDYPTNERTVDVPVQITFPNPKDPKDVQNDLYKFLKEGKITITFDDWTGEHSQDEKLLDLLQAAKTIQGVYFSKGG